MRSTTTSKKLSLSPQTLRVLSPQELARAAGAGTDELACAAYTCGSCGCYKVH